MILMREVIAAARLAGGLSASCNIAVAAVAHPQPVFERFDMDVRGLGLHRPGEDLVDQADHRRLARHVLQPLGIVLACVARGVVGGRTRFLVRIQALQCGIQLDRYSDLQAHAHVDGGGNGRGDEAVERVGQRHHQRFAVDRDRQGARVAQEAGLQGVGEQRQVGRIAIDVAQPAGQAWSHRPLPGRAR